MLKLILAFALTATVASAQEDPCGTMGEMAEKIMAIRQMGGNMSDLIGPLSAQPESAARDIALAMVKDAYNQPRFDTPEFQQSIIRDFRNGVEALCYAQMGELQ